MPKLEVRTGNVGGQTGKHSFKQNIDSRKRDAEAGGADWKRGGADWYPLHNVATYH